MNFEFNWFKNASSQISSFQFKMSQNIKLRQKLKIMKIFRIENCIALTVNHNQSRACKVINQFFRLIWEKEIVVSFDVQRLQNLIYDTRGLWKKYPTGIRRVYNKFEYGNIKTKAITHQRTTPKTMHLPSNTHMPTYITTRTHNQIQHTISITHQQLTPNTTQGGL